MQPRYAGDSACPLSLLQMQRYFATLRDWERTDGEFLGRCVNVVMKIDAIQMVSNRPCVVS